MAVVSDWNPTAEEYHAERDHISHSALEVFRQSRRLYHGRFVTGKIERPEPSGAMRLGTAMHILIWEPKNWNKLVAPLVPAVAPDGKKWLRRTGSDHERWWNEFVDSCAGKLILTEDEMILARAMAASIERNKVASHWLQQPGQNEHTITWQDHETGLLCKSRRDRFIESQNLLIDLKTCRDASPEGFAKSAASFGYNRQAAWYMDGHKAFAGQLPHFLFIAVCTTPPYEVACYELDADAIDLGRRQNRTALFALADCIEHDDWHGPHEKQVTTLSLPRWAENNEWEFVQ